MTGTVNDVTPTAAVTNSGPTPEGSAVTFTLANLQDQTPGDTPTILVDWDGSGQFEELTSDELTTNPDGSISFTHSYDEGGSYNAVVRIMDGSGSFTDYTSNVVVTEAVPTIGYFGASDNYPAVTTSEPLVFQDVTDPSLADTLAGFTYYVSIDGGAYTSSSSPYYYLPSDISLGDHNVSGYVQDNEGQTSAVYTADVDVATTTAQITNGGDTGQIELNWTGAPSPVVVDPNTTYTSADPLPNLTITLLTPGATYNLLVNQDIAQVNAAAGVTGVNLSIEMFKPSPMFGNGDIGEIDLPSDSTLYLETRGNLGSIVGPSSDGALTGCSATDLIFANLTGSITGLDSIGMLWAGNEGIGPASGWLGTSASQVVDVAAGIGSLSAYGVGATVYADERQDTDDPAMDMTVGDGGVPGEIDGGNVSNMDIAGDSNLLYVNYLEGPATVRGVKNFTLSKTNENAFVKTQNDVGELTFDSNAPQKIGHINVQGSINTLTVKSGLTVTDRLGANAAPGNISATKIGTIQVTAGNLSAEGIVVPEGIDKINVAKGNLTLTKKLDTSSIGSFYVAGNLTAYIEESNGASANPLRVGGNFVGGLHVVEGKTPPIRVTGNFTRAANQTDPLVSGSQIDVIAGGNIGGKNGGRDNDGTITSSTIKQVSSNKGSILLSNITASSGNLQLVTALNGKVTSSLTALAGNIIEVEAKVVAGNLSARVSTDVNANTTPQAGGNIFSVWSENAIPDNVKFSADWYIYQIKVKNPKRAEKFAVDAQGGATWNLGQTAFQAQGPLIIDVGTGSYLGKVRFLKRSSEVADATFKSGDVLLTVKTNKQNDGTQTITNWAVAGDDPNPTTVKATFARLTAIPKGTTVPFGLVRITAKLSREELSISGPSGNEP